MSKRNLTKLIQKELEMVNENIDLKIIKGLPYKSESKRHKFLISQLINLNTFSKAGFFQKSLNYLSTIVL